jgi:hypothetical protein
MNSNYTGLTQSYWIGTWSAPNGAYPVVLDTEIRGGLRTITANSGETLTDISGLFLQDGMLVYLQKDYISTGGINYTGGLYYKYTNTGQRSTTSPRGILANGDSYWSPYSVDLSNYITKSQTGNFYTKNNPSGFIADAPSNGTGYIRKNNAWTPNNEPLSPFPSRSNININYSAGNISSIMYTYTGATQGYADYSYDGFNNLLSISYKAANHSTVLRTLTFGYNGSNITGYIVT